MRFVDLESSFSICDRTGGIRDEYLRQIGLFLEALREGCHEFARRLPAGGDRPALRESAGRFSGRARRAWPPASLGPSLPRARFANDVSSTIRAAGVCRWCWCRSSSTSSTACGTAPIRGPPCASSSPPPAVRPATPSCASFSSSLCRILAVAALILFLARPLAGGWLGWAALPRAGRHRHSARPLRQHGNPSRAAPASASRPSAC